MAWSLYCVLDVDPGVGQRAADGAELARHLLLEAPDQHRPDCRGAKARLFQRGAGGFAVLDQEMGVPDPVDGEHAAALEANTRRAQRLAEAG